MNEVTPRKSLTRRVAPWALLAATVGLWLWHEPGDRTLERGAMAPALEVPWTEPGELDLGDRRHVTVLAFWATWCPACRQEGPTLSRVHARISPQGDRVIGVSVDRMALPEVERAARALGMTYPLARADTATADRFGVSLLPTVYVVDAEGRVADVFTGMVGERTLLDAVEAARTPSAHLTRR